MEGNKIKVYWIFLLLLLYTGVLVMSVGQAQARYDSTAVSTTMLKTDAIGIYSNCMVRSGEPAVTVLLGDLEKNETITVPITIQCVGEGYSGKLLCGVTEKSDQEYLDLFVSPTGQEAQWKEDEEKILTLGSDGKIESIDLTLTIKPTSDATDVPHEMLKINVMVTWGEEMWGTFQVILPEVTKPPEKQEGIDHTEESDGAEGYDELEDDEDSDGNEELEENDNPDENLNPDENTDHEESNEQNEFEYLNSEGENSAQLKTLSVFDLNDTLPVLMEVTDDIISVRLGMLETEDQVVAFPKGTRLSLDGGKSYYMMYTDYAPEFVLEKSAAEEKTEDPETAAEKENVTEPSQTATDESSEAENLSQEEEIPETQDQTQEAENPAVQPLAEGEENPADQGKVEGEENLTDQNPTGEAENPTEQDLAVGEENPPKSDSTAGTDNPPVQDMPAEENQDDAQKLNQILLLLDFRHTKLNNGQQLLLAMEAYSDSERIDCAYAETTVGITALTTNVLPVAEAGEVPEESQPEEGQLEEESKPNESIQKYSEPILNQNYYMELTVPEAWKELDVDLESETDCILEMLTMTDDGPLVYREVSITEETFLLTYTNDEQGDTDNEPEHKLELKLGEKLPQAGTYRLNLNWKYEGVLFKQTQTTFFINYSEYLNRDLDRLEMQTND